MDAWDGHVVGSRTYGRVGVAMCSVGDTMGRLCGRLGDGRMWSARTQGWKTLTEFQCGRRNPGSRPGQALVLSRGAR